MIHYTKQKRCYTKSVKSLSCTCTDSPSHPPPPLCKSSNRGTHITRGFGLFRGHWNQFSTNSHLQRRKYSFRDTKGLAGILTPSHQETVNNCATGRSIPRRGGNSMNNILTPHSWMSRSPKSVYLFLPIETQKSNSNLDEAFSIRLALGTSVIVKTEYITWIVNKNFSLHVCLFEKTLLWVTAKLIYIFVATDWHILSGTFLPYGSHLFFLFCTQNEGTCSNIPNAKKIASERQE